ncbi:hypothetical protein B0H14DRAFT_3774734 [Mycena olivaceomarginata]|nr:hypothetical protein B0H14DRAFT_3774734 [Mycena olivaceomarginata]
MRLLTVLLVFSTAACSTWLHSSAGHPQLRSPRSLVYDARSPPSRSLIFPLARACFLHRDAYSSAQRSFLNFVRRSHSPLLYDFAFRRILVPFNVFIYDPIAGGTLLPDIKHAGSTFFNEPLFAPVSPRTPLVHVEGSNETSAWASLRPTTSPAQNYLRAICSSSTRAPTALTPAAHRPRRRPRRCHKIFAPAPASRHARSARRMSPSVARAPALFCLDPACRSLLGAMPITRARAEFPGFRSWTH